MCGRYTLTYSDLGAVAELLGAILDESAAELHRPRFNVAPTNRVVIARSGEAPSLVPAIWGSRFGPRFVINLRAESAASRLRDTDDGGRCIVPADGFYEWHGEKAARRPVWFHAEDGAPLFMAGLVKEAESGPPTFVVLTQPAEPPVAAIHDRMPVIFDAEHARRWLARAPKAVRGSAVELVATPVSQHVNAAANDDPECIEPDVQARRQRSLP